jgi:proteasome lid subunit RPN8/RPN11
LLLRRWGVLMEQANCHRGGLGYPVALIERLVALAEAAPHREVCGFVARWPDGSFEPMPVENALPCPFDRAGYRMDPIAQLRAMQAIDRRGGEIAAVYHSHPEAGAELSDRDREAAAVGGTQMVPGADQIVMGMRGGRVFEARCHPQPKRGSAPTQTVG